MTRCARCRFARSDPSFFPGPCLSPCGVFLLQSEALSKPLVVQGDNARPAANDPGTEHSQRDGPLRAQATGSSLQGQSKG